MRPRHAALLTPSKSSHPTQLLSRQHFVRVSPLAATLTKTIGGSLLASTPLRTLRFDLPSLSTYNLKLTTLTTGSSSYAPATLFPPWHANASANTSSPISIYAKRSLAPFAFRRIPPC